MKDVVVSFFFRCSERGASLESDVGGRNQSRVRNVERKYLRGVNHISPTHYNDPACLRGPRVYILLGSSSKTLDFPRTLTDTQTSGMVPNTTSRDEPCDISRDMTFNRAFPFLDLALALAKLPPFLELLSRTWDKNYAFPQPVVMEELARVFVSQP
jgi:hypothetical protein